MNKSVEELFAERTARLGISPKENDNCNCDMCIARFNMQCKYIKQIQELYCDQDDFNDIDMKMNKFYISILPLQEEEVRGVDKLISFTKFIAK